MQIEHIGLWTTDLESMKQFYQTYFQAKASALYHNPKTKFSSYFLSFDSGARLEIMHNANIQSNNTMETLGYAHLAISLGSKKSVDQLTQQLVSDGYLLIGPTRQTGDGYYESVISDPEGNRIELTI